jgi:hypothetical protein
MNDNFSTLDNKSDSTVIIELHPCEIQLIRALRNNWRFGEVTIIVREGIPVRLKRVEEFIDLTK